MPDFKNPDASEGVANIKFSAFLEMNNMFSKYRMFCSDNREKKAILGFEIKLFDDEPDDTMWLESGIQENISMIFSSHSDIIKQL